jgi:microcin C transport system permease protein
LGAYILRRLLLVIPTLLGIMIINFTLTQFVPGGPIEQIIARIEGGGDVFEGIAGGSSEIARRRRGRTSATSARGAFRRIHRGARARVRLRQAAARAVPDDDVELHPLRLRRELLPLDQRGGPRAGEDAGVDHAGAVVDGDRLSRVDPAGHPQGGARRDELRHLDLGLIIVAYAIPGFLFAILLLVLLAGGSYLQIFPLRGLTSDNWEQLSLFGKIADYFWHITLPVLASTISAFATLTLLTKNSFLDEIKKQYVVTAKAKGLSEARVLYGHVFRNAMLIVIAGFPAVFIGVFFGGSLIIETIFSLDGLGRLGFEAAVARDYPVIFGTLFFFGLIGLVVGILSDLMYVFVDPRIDFERREA